MQQLIEIKKFEPLQRFEIEMKLMGMSEDSVETYLRFNKALIKFANKPLMEIDETDIKGFLLILLENNARNVANMALAAIRFFHQGVLGKKFPDLDHSSRRNQRLINREKMVKMLKSTKNMKHKLLIELVFGCGLKVSEAIKLKKEDINMKKHLIKVPGKENRIVRIPNLVARDLAFLSNYSQKKNPYVFQPATGRENQEHVSRKDVESALIFA